MGKSIGYGITQVVIDSRFRSRYAFAREIVPLGLRVGFRELGGKSARDREVIGIGVSVPCELAIPVVQGAARMWPQLKYLVLSPDLSRNAFEARHYQVLIGNRIPKSIAGSLEPWSVDEIEVLTTSTELQELHALVRSKYRINNGGTVITFVGGALDGREEIVLESAKELAAEFIVPDGTFYRLNRVGDLAEYRSVSLD